MRALLCTFSFLYVLMAPFAASAQPIGLWSLRFYVNDGVDLILPTIYTATELLDGDFIVAGDANPTAAFSDAFVARITPDGTVSWYRTLGTDGCDEAATAVVEMVNDNLMVVGYGGSGSRPDAVMIWGLTHNGDSLWSRSYGSSGWTQGNDACLLPDGNVVIVGFRLGFDLLRSDLWLLKCTPDGDTLWTKTIGGLNIDIGDRILRGPEDRLIIGGSSRTYGQGDYDVWMLQTNSFGQVLSSSTSGTVNVERCCDMFVAEDMLYIAGIAANTSGTESDGYLMKADLSGQVIWESSYDAGFADETFRGAAIRFNGGIRCVGWAGSGVIDPQPWIANISPDGFLWQSWIGDEFQMGQFYGIIPVIGGRNLIYGTVTEDTLHKGYVLCIDKGAGISGIVTDTDLGEPLGGVRVEVLNSTQSAATDPVGYFDIEIQPGTYSLAVTGPCMSSDTTIDIVVFPDSIVQVDLGAGTPYYDAAQTSVNIIANNHVPSAESFVVYNRGSGPMCYSITTEIVIPAGDWLSVSPAQGTVPPHDSTVVEVIVNANEPGIGIYDYYGYLNVWAHSCPDTLNRVPVFAVVLDAGECRDLSPTEFALHAPYPNPFNAETRLSYSLPHATRIRLSVYDVTGRLTRVLDEGRREAGNHEITFHAAGLPSGMYLLRLESEAFSAAQKLLLLK